MDARGTPGPPEDGSPGAETTRRAEAPATAAGAAPAPFRIKDCALIAIATGLRAYSLRELRDRLRTIPPDSLYQHFWGTRLRARFDDPEFQNDIAAWVRHGLHDGPTAERLGVIDPTGLDGLEALRNALLEVLEDRIEESDELAWRRGEYPFNFLTSHIVVFDTHREVADPRDLPAAVGAMSDGSVFYHVIDARRRTPEGTDDFRVWLMGFGETYREPCQQLADIDPFFLTLVELRELLAARLAAALGPGAR